ncbi:MAG: SRPBCC family protein [Chloroflexota bacterium]|nr:SRPBCC family protein [Chloroflexota bacterium]
MATVEKAIEVEVPINVAYNQWTQFEEFPRFMDGVEQVTQLDDTRIRWVAKVGGRRKEWTAKIVEQVPDQIIAWQAEEGSGNAGIVRFQPLGPERTLVDVQMEYEPEDFMEAVGDRLGFMARRLEADLKRFKEFIEARRRETGGWRGSVHGGEPYP